MKFNIVVDHEQFNTILAALNDAHQSQLVIDLCNQALEYDDSTTEVSDLTFNLDTIEAEEAIYAIVDALDDLEEAYDRVSKKTGLV